MVGSSAAQEEVFNVMGRDFSNYHGETVELQFQPQERIVSAKVDINTDYGAACAITFLVFLDDE